MNILKRLWRWHPEVALRYLPIVKRIRSFPKTSSILEIGSGSLGIAPYLGRELIGLDLDFSGPQTDLLIKVKGSALNPPFNSQSFDIVLLVDVLEHLPLSHREKAIREAFRISKKMLIISVPSGREAEAEDKYLASLYLQKFGREFKYYQEHLNYHLPKEKWISDTIKKVGYDGKRSFSQGVESSENISLHRFLMKGWLNKNPINEIIFRKLLIIFIPIMLLFNQRPTYRKNFYIKFR